MKASVILNTTTRFLIAMLLMFSVYLLLRGHNMPGGGFVGGLVGGASFALYTIAFGVREARRAMPIGPRLMIAWGMLIALVSGFPALFLGRALFEGLWDMTPVPLIGKFGTPLAFDIGVYMVVAGVTLNIIFTLSEADREEHP